MRKWSYEPTLRSEKMEIIRLVENSDLSIRDTLKELDVPKTSFYRWYHRYQEEGYDGLADRGHGARRFWNKIPQQVRDEVVEMALAEPEKSPQASPNPRNSEIDPAWQPPSFRQALHR